MKYILFILFSALVYDGKAQTVTWDGGGGNASWHNPLNWDTDVVPCTTCEVVISGATVSFTVSDTIKKLTVNANAHVTIGSNKLLEVQGGAGAFKVDNALITNYGIIRLSLFTEIALNIINSGVFSNSGVIYIVGGFSHPSERGIEVSGGQLINNLGSSIGITDLYRGPFFCKNNGTANNYGNILITNCGSVGTISGINNEANFNNYSSGIININNILGIGLSNDDLFTNYGSLIISDIVPTSSSNNTAKGIFNNGTFNNELGAFVTISNTMQYAVQNYGILNNAGSISSDFNIPNNYDISVAILSNKFLSNSGTISIANVTGYGLINGTNADSLVNSGNITINSTSQPALYNQALFKNSGNIIIDQIGSFGISIADTLINSGHFNISNCQSYGLLLYKYFLNETSGSIDVSDIAGRGISVSLGGNFINNGAIDLSRITEEGIGVSGFDSFTPGTFLNTINGNVHIHDTFNSGIRSSGSVNNYGHITMRGFVDDNTFYAGLYNSGRFYNNGGLDISNTPGNGIVSLPQNDLKFENDGDILIKDSWSFGFVLTDSMSNTGSIVIEESDAGFSFENSSIVENEGNLEVLNCPGTHVTNKGKFYNSGTLNLQGSTTFGLLNSAPFGIVNNNFGGKIIIDEVTNAGIENNNILNNYGKIEVSEVILYGISNKRKLYNHGAINLDNASFFHESGFEDAVIHNYSNGTIYIESSTDDGLLARRNFINEGKLTVSTTTGEGIVFMPTFFPDVTANGDTLVNSGSIYVFNSPVALKNLSSGQNLFLNKSSGKIHIEGQLINENEFLNDGLVFQNYVLNNTFSDVFQNNGVFVDTKDIQNPSVNFINNGLLLKPLKGKTSSGIKEMNIVERTGPTTFLPVKTWYINPLKTVTGGVFSSVDNSFTPNANTIYADTLYFNVTDNTITHAIKIPLRKVAFCPNFPTATFTQAVSTDWHISANWDTGKAPDYCTIAIIPNTKKSVITAGRKARAHKILSVTGSVFDAELGVVLEVDNLP